MAQNNWLLRIPSQSQALSLITLASPEQKTVTASQSLAQNAWSNMAQLPML